MTTEQYVTLSALAYVGFNNDSQDKTIGELTGLNKLISLDLQSRSEYGALGSLSNLTLINYQPNTPTGFAAAAFQSPDGQIIFAFRGTEPKLLSDPVKAIHAFLINRLVSMHTLAV